MVLKLHYDALMRTITVAHDSLVASLRRVGGEIHHSRGAQIHFSVFRFKAMQKQMVQLN